ncbi:MAG: fimbrillin family protein [Bacteroidales bacterium]|nr:fimbrillin family protein [Bacteroidales bacterium]
MLSSCSQNIIHPGDPVPVVFSATASHSTKAIITTTNYPLDEPFLVQAYHTSKGDKTSVLIERERVQYDFGTILWKTDNEYFWPEAGDIRFYAGSPILPEIGFTAENGMVASWSIPGDEYTQTDLCFAEATERCESHSATVPIVFSHALSQVCFKARTLKQYSYSRQENNFIQANVITVVLDSVKLGGIISKGRFTQIPRGWELDGSETAVYTVYKNDEGLQLNCDRYDNPILEKLSTMLLIPQSLPEGAYIEEWHHINVRSSITDLTTGQILSDGTNVLPVTQKISLKRYCPEWETDIKYTFRIAVGMDDPAEITTAVTDWTETKEIIIGDE